MKFGGTSVQNEEAIRRVVSIVKSRLSERPLVVVSALAKVTRLLVQIAEESGNGNKEAVERDLASLRERHLNLCAALLEGELLDRTEKKVVSLCDGLSGFTEGVLRMGELSPRSRARIISTGELLSSTIVSAAFNAAGVVCNWMDARAAVVTDDDYMDAAVRLEETEANVRRIFPVLSRGADMVLTQGFIASTSAGDPSVLGFEGSDYSAAIFAMSLGAAEVQIWTDVDGVRTSDPRAVRNTERIERLSYDEAAAMAESGARVLHPLTIGPARMRNIPIRVLNTMNPDCEGTLITGGNTAPGPKCVAFIPDIDYLEIRAREYGQAERMAEEVLPQLLSVASGPSLLASSAGRLSMTFEKGGEALAEAVEKFRTEYEVNLYRDKARLSVVGNGVPMCEEVIGALRGACRQVHMVCTGAAMMDVSIVVDRESLVETADKIHGKLF